MKQFAAARDPASDFYVIDVGASGGIAAHWKLFGDRLRAVGFDPLISEVERLNKQEQRPRVRYEAAFVGAHNFDELFPPELRNDRLRSRNNDPFQRVSAVRAQEILSMDYVREVFNRGEVAAVADRVIALDDYVPKPEYDAVDFIKVDTDGHDFEVLLGARDLLDGHVLGLMVEAQLHGPVHEYANTFSNIDRFMRNLGFSLFDLEAYRYSRSALPAPFVYDIPAQTESGQLLWGDALYLRDLGDPAYADKFAFSITQERVLTLATLFVMFDLADCAAELLVTRADLVPDPLRTRLQDGLAAAAARSPVTYREYVAGFERDPRTFYPAAREAEVPAPVEPVPAATPTPEQPPDTGEHAVRLAEAVAEIERLKERLQQLKLKHQTLRQRLESRSGDVGPAAKTKVRN